MNHLPAAEGKGSSWDMSLLGCRGKPVPPSLRLPPAYKCQQKASIRVSSVAEGHFGVCLVLAWT